MLPSGEKKVFRKVMAVAVLLFLSWIMFAPGAGLLSFFGKLSDYRRLEERANLLEKENAALQQDIERLLADPQYLEDIARRKHNLLKKNEKVFDFSRSGK
ncbi:cell division protein FtsB [Desulforhopalus singaporensis]|uniref:Cell division protein FtsB n=2 Tax=Desulforhopalus singaporensis TaxID=91360 RepID=A0A1H0M5V9_9BACT|nr:cell division protein FtsB [Desulforhopalus singaporensis]